MIVELVAKSHFIFIYFFLSFVFLFYYKEKYRNHLLIIYLLTLISGTCYLYLNYSISLLGILHVASSLIIVFFIFTKKWKRSLIGICGFSLLTGFLLHYGVDYFSQERVVRSDQFHPQKEIYYNKIQPILRRKCVKCHNSKNDNINLSSLKGLLKSKSLFYNVIESKKPFVSGLYLSINKNPQTDGHMPYLDGDLSPNEVSVIKKWIEDGAVKLTDLSVNESKAAFHRQKFYSSNAIHWSEDKSYPAEFNAGKKNQQLYNNYLALVKAETNSYEKMDLGKIHVSRRSSILLSGLYPNKAVAHELSAKFFKSIDKLFKSYHYAETLALLWFDISGFADQVGVNSRDMIKNSHIYKQYVVDFYHQDGNYLQFVKNQTSNREKKPNDFNHFYKYQPHYSKKPIISSEIAIQNLFSFTLGLQMKCAKCHDHSYAPVSNEEYYQQINSISNNYSIKDLTHTKNRRNKEKKLTSNVLSLYNRNLHDLSLPEWLTNQDQGVGFYTARTYVDTLIENTLGYSIMGRSFDVYARDDKPKLLPLLNWLTQEFLKNNSSTKYLLKKIMTSELFTSVFKFNKLKHQKSYNLYGPIKIKAEYLRDNLYSITGVLDIKNRTYDKSYLKKKVTLLLDDIKLKNNKSIYLKRKRVITEDSYDKYLNIPKGYSTRSARPNYSDTNEIFFLTNKIHISELISLFHKKYAITSFDETKINKVYSDLFSRHINNQERVTWKRFFSENILKENTTLFYHLLLTSDELMYY